MIRIFENSQHASSGKTPKAVKLWKLVVVFWGPFQSGVKVICMVFKK
jgi:hypothetical protein